VQLSIVGLDADQVQGVNNQHRLDLLVQRARTTETWRDVNLQEMWSQFLVQQNVKTVNFKAHISVFVASRVAASDLGLVSDASLDNYILYAVEHLIIIDAIFREVIFQLHQIPFGCVFILALGTLSLDVVICAFVNGVICQMNESFFQHLRIICVFLSRKPNEALLIKEDLQRVETGDNDVDSQIVLKPVNEMRIRNVLADNVAGLLVDLGLGPYHFDSLSATACRWLHNVHVLVA
jgi:hypothetical protein